MKTKEEIIQDLREMADPRAKEIWIRFGLQTKDEYLGCQLTKLKAYAKKLRKDHDMALTLWDSGIHDAKLLSTMIEEPKKVAEEQIDRQIKEIYSTDIADKYCSNVVASTPFSAKKIMEWADAEGEMIKRSAYTLLSGKAKYDTGTPDSWFEAFLKRIEKELPGERNWVKETMNYALIAIGGRSRALNEAAKKVAQKIGKVVIDYGDTSCKSPDAMTVLNSAKTQEKLK